MVILRSLTGIVLLALVVPLLVHESFAQNCGPEGGGQSCASPNCCSEFGFCNVGEDYCGAGCQPAYGNCNGGTPTTPAGDCGAGVGGVASEDQYTSIFPFPPRNALYTYSAFIEATGLYSEFANTGDCSTRRREIAAFFANIHHETGGLAFVEETNPSGDYCDPTNGYACAAGKRYYGRGPVQLSWNYNYKQCGDAIGVDLLNNPELVATDGVISFKTAMWFWQTAQSPKPSCHDVMTGLWSPSAADAAGGRQPGFGMTINIINGGKECGATPENTSGAESRIILFKQICGNLGVDTGSNLLCSSMTPY